MVAATTMDPGLNVYGVTLGTLHLTAPSDTLTGPSGACTSVSSNGLTSTRPYWGGPTSGPRTTTPALWSCTVSVTKHTAKAEIARIAHHGTDQSAGPSAGPLQWTRCHAKA